MPKPPTPTLAGVFAGIPICTDATLPPDHVAIVSGDKRTLFRINVEAETADFVREERWPIRPVLCFEVAGDPLPQSTLDDMLTINPPDWERIREAFYLLRELRQSVHFASFRTGFQDDVRRILGEL